MRPELAHQEMQELLGAYALDAVAQEETARMEEHLRECPRCRAEVDRHREAAAMLAGGGLSAPAHLWDRISAALEEAPPRLDVARLRRGGRGRGLPRWLAAVAAVVVAGLTLLGLRVLQLGGEVESLRADARHVQLMEVAAQAAGDPQARLVRLRSEDGSTAVSAVILPDGQGYLLGGNLRPLPSDRTYQLWALAGDRAISAGVLGPDPAVVAFRVARGTGGLAITVERAGGVVKSWKVPVVVAELHTA